MPRKRPEGPPEPATPPRAAAGIDSPADSEGSTRANDTGDGLAQAAEAAQQDQQQGMGAASRADTQSKDTEHGPLAQADAPAGQQGMGNVADLPAGGEAASQANPPTHVSLTVTKRLQKDGRWKSLGLEDLRNSMMRECRKKGMDKEAAQLWTYSELDRLYPPEILIDPKAQPTALLKNGSTQQESGQGLAANSPPATSEGGRVQGLGDLPPAWPELPANASLAAEVAWVQAERLRIVEERNGGGMVVRLERARSPAPSMAALAWLETSIRIYAKWVEVAAKASGAGQDEQDQARAERLALDEVRALLAEMQ